MVVRRWVAVLALILAALVAGCDRTLAGIPLPAKTWHPTTTAPPTTTTTTTTQPAPPTAADGTNYAACATRTCQISVSGPVDIRIGGSAPGTLSVKDVNGDAVDFTLTLDDGESANGTLKPGCDTATVGGGGMSGTFGSPGGTACQTQPPPASPGAVTVEMPWAANGVAIIWIVIA